MINITQKNYLNDHKYNLTYFKSVVRFFLKDCPDFCVVVFSTSLINWDSNFDLLYKVFNFYIFIEYSTNLFLNFNTSV